MHPRLKLTAIVTLITFIVVPIIVSMMGFGLAVTVLSAIAVLGFFTVVVVMVVGSLENEAHPHSPEESAAVKAWRERLGEPVESSSSSSTETAS